MRRGLARNQRSAHRTGAVLSAPEAPAATPSVQRGPAMDMTVRNPTGHSGH